MDEVLPGFVRALRAAGADVSGADVSGAESIDAARAVAVLGYADRANLKAALAVSLAKSAAGKTILDRVFDRYFTAPASASGRLAADAYDRQPPSTGEAAVDSLLLRLYRNGQGNDGLNLALAQAARAADVDNIRFAAQTPYCTRRMLEALGIAALEVRLLAHMGNNGAASQAGARALGAARDALQRHARTLVAQRFELFGRPATDAFMADVVVNRPIGRMGTGDMDPMKRAVTRMARRLAQRHGHRRRTLLRGRLDLRRTLRANAGHGGVALSMVFKRRRRERPRLVVVCDVSGSVAPYVRFLLMFLHALQGTVTDLRTFAFSNRLKDVAAPLAKLPFDDAMALILKEVGSGATDFGQAWLDLQTHHWQVIDRRTTVLVLGHGRSNHSDPRLDLFAQLAGRAKGLSGGARSQWVAGAAGTVAGCACVRSVPTQPIAPAPPTWSG